MQRVLKCSKCRAPSGVVVLRASLRAPHAGVWRRAIWFAGDSWRNAKGNPTTFEPVPDVCARELVKVEALSGLCDWCLNRRS